MKDIKIKGAFYMLELALTVLCWTGVVTLVFGMLTELIWIQHYAETCQQIQTYLSLVNSGIVKVFNEEA